MDYKLFATKDNAEGQLDSNISAVSTTISLKPGEGALFPATINGSATSGGDNVTLNSTGIQAAGVAIGDFIYNVTDGSHAFVKTVSANSITTTPLLGGGGNTWDNADIWAVNPFVITLNKRNVSGVITQSEKVLIRQRSTDDLIAWSGGRGFDGSTPATYDADDYVNLFAISKSIEYLIDAISELAQIVSAKADESSVTQLLNARNWKQSVRVATTAAGTLASDFEDGDTIDGVVLATGDRILIKDQASLLQNGVYTVNASGAPTRAIDFDDAAEATSAVIPVEEGATNPDTIWICTDEAPNIGVDDINFAQYGSSSTISSQSEAEAGVNNVKMMTPLRTKQAIDYNNAEQITAGENIDGSTTPKAVFISRGTSDADTFPLQVQETENDTDQDVHGVNYKCQTFTTGTFQTKLTKIDLMLMKVGAPAGNFQLDIYAVDGSSKPTGASLATKTITASTVVSTYLDWVAFALAATLTVTPATEYAIVGRVSAGDGSNYIEWQTGNGNTYAGGQAWTSADSGGSWSSQGNDHAFRVWGYEAQTAGRLYMSDNDEPFRGGFDGYVTSNTTAGNPATIRLRGRLGGFSGLTKRAIQYVGSTIGGRTESTGGLKTGYAISDTEIEIEPEGGFVEKTLITTPTLNGATVTTPLTYQVVGQCGFKPSRVKLAIQISANGTGGADIRYGVFNGEYTASLRGTATKIGSVVVGGTNAGAVEIVSGSSYVVQNLAGDQTVTAGSFTLTNTGLTFTISENAANRDAVAYVLATYYR